MLILGKIYAMRMFCAKQRKFWSIKTHNPKIKKQPHYYGCFLILNKTRQILIRTMNLPIFFIFISSTHQNLDPACRKTVFRYAVSLKNPLCRHNNRRRKQSIQQKYKYQIQNEIWINPFSYINLRYRERKSADKRKPLSHCPEKQFRNYKQKHGYRQIQQNPLKIKWKGA